MTQTTEYRPATITADIIRLLQSLVSRGALVQEGQARWSRYHLPEAPHSVHKAGDSVHKSDDSVHKGDDSVHNTETATLSIIATPARENQRLEPDAMEQLILTLCQDRWLSRNQLADLLQRNPDGLRSRFLTPMVAHGLLRLRYPDKPNRADQSYTTSGKDDA